MINPTQYTSYKRKLDEALEYLNSDFCKSLNGYIEGIPDPNENYTGHNRLVACQGNIREQIELLVNYAKEKFNV